MSGGQRIDDHKFWAGGKSKDSVFPKGVHTKSEGEGKHGGHLKSYEDTTEAIERQQNMGVSKAHGHNMKPLHRN